MGTARSGNRIWTELYEFMGAEFTLFGQCKQAEDTARIFLEESQHFNCPCWDALSSKRVSLTDE